MIRCAAACLVLTMLSGMAALCAAAGDRRAVEMVESGKWKVARASWWGFDAQDSTEALQAAINSGARRLVVDNMGQPWVVKPLTLVSNQQIVFEPGVEVVAKRGEFRGKGDSLFSARNAANISLVGYGATLRMRRSDYAAPPYEKAEWRHALRFASCSNVKVYGLTLTESGGDGIYLGTATKGVTNKNVHIRDVVCERNYRQGISVISAEDLLIENTVMRETAGTPPQAGIDFEPNNADERLVNITMRNCLTERNAGDGYEFYLAPLNSFSAPVSVRIERCRSVGDKRCSVRVVRTRAGGNGVSGRIEFVDCVFEGSGEAAVKVPEQADDFQVLFVPPLNQ